MSLQLKLLLFLVALKIISGTFLFHEKKESEEFDRALTLDHAILKDDIAPYREIILTSIKIFKTKDESYLKKLNKLLTSAQNTEYDALKVKLAPLLQELIPDSTFSFSKIDILPTQVRKEYLIFSASQTMLDWCEDQNDPQGWIEHWKMTPIFDTVYRGQDSMHIRLGFFSEAANSISRDNSQLLIDGKSFIVDSFPFRYPYQFEQAKLKLTNPVTEKTDTYRLKK